MIVAERKGIVFNHQCLRYGDEFGAIGTISSATVTPDATSITG